MFQSIALHDTLTFVRRADEFRIECDDPVVSDGRGELGVAGCGAGVARRWASRPTARRGRHISSSAFRRRRVWAAAAAMRRPRSARWRRFGAPRVPTDRQRAMAAALGADVPFFLQGGTALASNRGDVLFPLVDHPAAWVTVLIPAFGVQTKDAYSWFDGARPAPFRTAAGQSALAPAFRTRTDRRVSAAASGVVNDLERPVAARHPAIARLVARLRAAGAYHAAMSGSGSAVFGLFVARRRRAAAGGGDGREALGRSVTRYASAERAVNE